MSDSPKLELIKNLDTASRSRSTIEHRIFYLKDKISYTLIKQEITSLEYALKLIDIDILQLQMMIQRLEDKEL